ncbi:hypothetical protein DSM112329_01452 [Paraconexibacter sp. AEG42_29]|uniref:Peptidase S55 domain-containing protein n=1 Tax=Paraconexibacter sp. AEG42_29 TaxID=2997339 RepID=A0AAU7AT07_9ACTN
MRYLRRTVLGALSCVGVLGAQAAHAAEPIMPLADVQKGMRCTAQSVVSGTDIATFDIEVLDVISGDVALRSPYILFRASGAAIDATGIGPGFSGSPISCPDAAGTYRVAGAISQGIGSYGNRVALATPIESILGEPVEPPAETRSAPALLRAARPLATPLSIGGLSAPTAQALAIAAKRTGRPVYAAPSAPTDQRFPVQQLRGGAAMAVGLASGDVTAGAIGTVAYVDGDKVWSFGHPLDSAGRRALFLQDAYVYSVIDNPTGSAELSTYKLAAPGHNVGTLTNDGTFAVVGRLGTLPSSYPLTITGTDLDRNTTSTARIQLADEAGLGLPTGSSALTQVGSLAIAEVAYDLLHSTPIRQSGSMCVAISLRERPKPMQFCNTYSGGTLGAGAGAALIADFSAATAQVDAYNFGPLHVTGVKVDVKLRRSLRQAYLLKVTAPERVRRGTTVRVRAYAQRVNGEKFAVTIPVKVPATTPLGSRRIQLDGTPGDGGGSLADALSAVLDLSSLFADDEDAESDGGSGPRTPKALAALVRSVHRYDGVTTSIPPVGGSSSDDPEAAAPTGAEADAQKARQAYRNPDVRISGTARVKVRIVK